MARPQKKNPKNMCRRHRGAIAYTPNVVLSSEYYQEQPFSHLEGGGNASKANSCQAGCNISQNMKLQQQSRSYLPVWKQGKLPSVTLGSELCPFSISLTPLAPAPADDNACEYEKPKIQVQNSPHVSSERICI